MVYFKFFGKERTDELIIYLNKKRYINRIFMWCSMNLNENILNAAKTAFIDENIESSSEENNIETNNLSEEKKEEWLLIHPLFF